jgi:hypothetical protein
MKLQIEKGQLSQCSVLYKELFNMKCELNEDDYLNGLLGSKDDPILVDSIY